MADKPSYAFYFLPLALAILLYLGVQFLQNVVVRFSANTLILSIDLTAALPLAILYGLGPIGLVGVPVGVLGADVISGSLAVPSVLTVAGHTYLGMAAWRCGERFGLAPGFKLRELFSFRGLAAGMAVLGLSTAGAAAVSGWGNEVLHQSPFYIAATGSLVGYIGAAMLLGIPMAWILRAVSGQARQSRRIASSKQFPTPDLRWISSLTVLWLLLGVLGSLGYRTFEQIPDRVRTVKNLEILSILDQPDLFGIGASRLQVVLGAVSLSLLVLTYRWGTPLGGRERA